VRRIGAAVTASCILALGACATNGEGEVGGMLLGAAVGAAIGAELAGDSDSAVGAALGAALGAYLGREIGQSLAEGDGRSHDEAARDALWNNAVGQPERWSNPRSGFRGEITPLSRTSRDPVRGLCRRFRDTVVPPDGAPRTFEGVACLRDGQWTVERRPDRRWPFFR